MQQTQRIDFGSALELLDTKKIQALTVQQKRLFTVWNAPAHQRDKLLRALHPCEPKTISDLKELVIDSVS